MAAQKTVWRLGLFLIILSVFVSCKEDEVVPSGDFSFEYENEPSFPIQEFATYWGIRMINNIEGAEQYAWDFGNGTTSNEKEPVVFYEEGGSYKISVLVTSSSGDQKVFEKEITIIDRKLKLITVNAIKWNGLGLLPWEDNRIADFEVELALREKDEPMGSISSVIFTSDRYQNEENNASAIVIPVSSEVIVKHQWVTNQKDERFVVNIYAVEGDQKLLFYTSDASGLGYFAQVDPQTGTLNLSSGSGGTSIELSMQF